MPYLGVRFLILATPFGIAGGALAEVMSPDGMSVGELKHTYIACERSAAGGPIPPGEIQHRSQVYEALKARTFGSDWQRLRGTRT